MRFPKKKKRTNVAIDSELFGQMLQTNERSVADCFQHVVQNWWTNWSETRSEII